MAIPIIGKIIDTVIDKGTDLISEFIPDKDKQAEFQMKLKLAALEDGQLERQAEVDMYEAQQETIQAELAQSDLYTKRTRPMLARRSMFSALGYAVGFELLAAFEYGSGAQWEILMLLASPGLAYMGVRGFEKWKAGGTK